MSSYKGRTVKNKSQTRKERKNVNDLNKQLLEDKDNPLKELLGLTQNKNDISKP